MKKNEIVKTPNSLRANGAQSVGLFLNKHATHIAIAVMAVMAMGTFVFATTGGTAGGNVETMWGAIATQVEKWVGRLALVLIFVGGVQFGLGWYNEDPGSKARGIQTMIAGGIVGAVALMTSQFFV